MGAAWVLTASLASMAHQAPRFKAAGAAYVPVFATVVDSSRRLLTGLHAGDFVLFDNDARQQVTVFSSEPVPIRVVVLLDR